MLSPVNRLTSSLRHLESLERGGEAVAGGGGDHDAHINKKPEGSEETLRVFQEVISSNALRILLLQHGIKHLG